MVTGCQLGIRMGQMEEALDVEGFAACPTCGMVDVTMTNAEVAVGGYWRCQRCGQQWDKKRLATVAAFDAWVAARTGRPAKSYDAGIAIRH